MRKYCAREGKWLTYDTAHTCMGVDHRVVVLDDDQMLLSRTRFEQQDIARLDWLIGRPQSGQSRESMPTRVICIAQPIAFGRDNIAAQKGEAGANQSHAIQTLVRVAAMEFERCAYESRRSNCQLIAMSSDQVPP